MRLQTGQARRRFTAQPVARLATVDARGIPHLVPVTFAVAGDTIVFAVDAKPKASTDLRRLRNIAANPNVSFLADHYDDDWSRLWWVRADGTATILHAADDPEAETDIALLRNKYPHYQHNPPHGPVVRTTVTAWRGWAASAVPD
ncbi:PPOX class probable F420-dependent enzyme [Saccharomonospora marina XMU15]|uniref:PPOX class probable F420-dependent enzyme n=1 Tax=Saccharomonospora marina XMU15 TaxID=882083 RepID=H5X5L3_9PSEU|nr:TIGR03668 family PPOX class F420-dependent oxidoreductase [Saccharomonospora marina]EHR51161.1 PPOX class probable F420-dependent enzyme [Saccharomonospora marina XMU15]